MDKGLNASDFWELGRWQDRYFFTNDIRCLLYERIINHKNGETIKIIGYDGLLKPHEFVREWTNKEEFVNNFKNVLFKNCLYNKITWTIDY